MLKKKQNIFEVNSTSRKNKATVYSKWDGLISTKYLNHYLLSTKYEQELTL